MLSAFLALALLGAGTNAFPATRKMRCCGHSCPCAPKAKTSCCPAAPADTRIAATAPAAPDAAAAPHVLALAPLSRCESVSVSLSAAPLAPPLFEPASRSPPAA